MTPCSEPVWRATSLIVGVDRLIAAGATAEDRRLFLVRVHDTRRNPVQHPLTATNEPPWVQALPAIAAARPRVIMVDLATMFDFVFARPAFVGLTNVGTADLARSATTALYQNGGHFGLRGHPLISQVVRYCLTRGWDAMHALAPGSDAAVTRRNEDISAGNVFRTV